MTLFGMCQFESINKNWSVHVKVFPLNATIRQIGLKIDENY